MSAGEDVETPKGLMRLNEDKYVDEAVGYLVKAIRRWGVKADGSDYDIDGLKTLLDFHRGGKTLMSKPSLKRTLHRLYCMCAQPARPAGGSPGQPGSWACLRKHCSGGLECGRLPAPLLNGPGRS